MRSKVPLSEIAEIVMGQSPIKSDVNSLGNGHALLNGPTEFGSRYPSPVQYTTNGKRFSEPGDILFCVRGSTTGRMNYSDQKYAIGRGLAAIRGKNGIPTPVVKAVIENSLPSVLQAATGSTFPNVSKDLLNNFLVEGLSVSEASELNKLITSIEDKIFNNSQMNQTLEKIAQRIFKSWFIDFAPVKANAEGVPYDGLSPEIQSLFPSEFVESEMGLIPKSWENKNISEVFNFNPKYKITKGQEAPFIEMKALPTSGMSVDYVLDKNFTSGSKFKNNDTLVARITPCLENGKTAYVNLLREDAIGWGSGEFIVISPKSIEQSEFIYCLARTGSFRAFSVSKMTGTSGRQRVSFQDMGSFQIAYPEGEGVVKAFSNICRPLFEKIAENSKQNDVLNSLRDRLLPKLLSGAIEIKDVEEQMAKAS